MSLVWLFRFTFFPTEYIEKAILNTSCDCIQSSLIVQHSHNLEQIELLKRRLFAKIHSKDSVSHNTVAVEHKVVPEQNKEMATGVEEGGGKHRHLFSILDEQDSLISSLVDQQSPEHSPTCERAELLNELQIITGKLRKATMNLMDSLDRSQAEVQSLQNENSQLRKELLELKCNNKTFPELPPLEPPTLLY